MNHRIILADGRTALLPNGQAAIQGEGGCPTCCGGDPDPSGPCACRPIIYQDRTCGLPRANVGLPAWELTIAGTVTYYHRELYRFTNTLRSLVPLQTRSFNVTRLYVPGSCGVAYEYPQTPEPVVTFTQTVAGGATPTLIISGSVDNSGNGFVGWDAQGTKRALWALSGPYTYAIPGTGLNFDQLTSSPFGVRIAGGQGNLLLGQVNDSCAAAWNAVTSEAFGAATVGGGLTSPAALRDNFLPNEFTSSSLGTAIASRTGCRYTLRRTASTAFSGVDFGPVAFTEVQSSFSCDYTITAQLISCVSGAAPPPPGTDPRILEAAERLLRQCKGCGDG